MLRLPLAHYAGYMVFQSARKSENDSFLRLRPPLSMALMRSRRRLLGARPAIAHHCDIKRDFSRRDT